MNIDHRDVQRVTPSTAAYLNPDKRRSDEAWRTKKRRDIRRAHLSDLKVKAGCADCGYNAHACALDFDHVRGEKKFNVAARVGMSLEALLAEVAKCDIVCSNCHRVRTAKRRVLA